MFFNQNSGFGKLKGYLTKFYTVYKGYQMHLGLKDLTTCIALAMAFALSVLL